MTFLERINRMKKRGRTSIHLSPPPRKIIPMSPQMAAAWISADSPDVYYYVNEQRYEP